MKMRFNLIAATAVVICIVTGQAALAGSEHSKSVAAPEVLYKNECGSCHMAYPPELLPAKTWQKIVESLDKHFGDNAEFNASDRQLILTYLNASSAENSKSRRAKKILSSTSESNTSLRITEIPYIAREHKKIAEKYVKNNPKVGSLSQCDKCHEQAQRGSFDEDDIVIPGHGRWED